MKTNIDTQDTNKLEKILAKILEGIETPTLQAQNTENAAERLIEQMEINSYPHEPIICPHHEEKNIGEDCVECQIKQYEVYQSHYLTFEKELGFTHTHTLKAAFDYYSTLITQYRLSECDELLNEIYEACVARGKWSSFYFMAIQARAFLRFKQGKYEDSLEYFHKLIEVMGPNEQIYENMALTYSRLNDFKAATICYAQAILLIRLKPPEEQRITTLLLGLSTVLENADDSLVVLNESLNLLKKQYDKPHSLMAKTLSGMGDLHIKQNDLSAALQCYQEAVTIFIDTCGYETPLTANAMNKHAKTLLALNKNNEANHLFIDALNVWGKVDDQSFEPNAVLEALLALRNQKLEKEPERLIQVLDLLKDKIVKSRELVSDINVLCLLKFIYELYIINGDIPRAIECCTAFRDSLLKLDERQLGANIVHRTQLLQETMELLDIIEKIPKKPKKTEKKRDDESI